MSVAWEEHVAFEAVCDFFEKVATEKLKKRRTEKLDHFLRDCREVEMGYGDGVTTSLFPVLGLILQLDRERGAFGIKETILAKLYIDFLKLGANSSAAAKLKNYRAPKSNQADAGDFAAVLYSVIRDRHYGDSKMTVAEVNSRLDDIVAANANEGRRAGAVETILLDLFRRMSGKQQKWLVRIILKDMKLGLGTNSVLNSFHPDAKDMLDVNDNLKKVCELLRDPNVRNNEIEVQLFTPFKPMLADPCAVADVEKQMGNKKFYIEVKYDGERLLVHKNGDQFKFFSRNRFDFTEDFGNSTSEARDKFCAYLSRCLDASVASVILDGEICPFNYVTSTLAQKGEQMNIRSIRSDDDMYQQCFYVYDVIYLNGKVLTNMPLRERLNVLSGVIKEMPGRVHFTDRKVGSTKKDVLDALNEAIDRRDEGIVLKDPDSVYKPSARSCGGWLKIKPEYAGELSDQCDLIVMGGYYGSGRGGGVVTHFLLGLAVRGEEAEARPIAIHSFCRVGSGYSARELAQLLLRLQPHFRKWKKESSSTVASGITMELGREKPDVLIDPTKSVILQVKAAEIVSSDVYTVGCTLRFPRVEKVRDDKGWSDCLSVAEMQALRAQAQGKLTNKHLRMDDDDDVDSANVKRPRLTVSRAKAAKLASAYHSIDTSTIMVETHDLKDKVIVVEPSNAEEKVQLEQIVVRLGGTVEQNVSDGRTFCYVATDNKLKAKGVINSRKFDVVKKNWLLDCAIKFRMPRPSDMLHTTHATAMLFENKFDVFGDSFAERATEESLRYSMQKVKELGMSTPLSHAEIADFESANFAGHYRFGLFRPLVFYVDKLAEIGVPETELELHPVALCEATVSFYGGKVVSALEPGTTHVVVHSSDLTRLVTLRQERRARREKFHIVNEEWVEDCVAKCELLEPRGYEPQEQ